MVRTSFLDPIVEAAARLGEDVVCARAAQLAFERRLVHKYIFTVAPASGGEASTAIGGGGGDSRRGLAVLPQLGQVISVAGKANLVCHQESLPLRYLRKSFLSIGRGSAWGKVCGSISTRAACYKRKRKLR